MSRSGLPSQTTHTLRTANALKHVGEHCAVAAKHLWFESVVFKVLHDHRRGCQSVVAEIAPGDAPILGGSYLCVNSLTGSGQFVVESI